MRAKVSTKNVAYYELQWLCAYDKSGYVFHGPKGQRAYIWMKMLFFMTSTSRSQTYSKKKKKSHYILTILKVTFQSEF